MLLLLGVFRDFRQLLLKCAATSLSSKLVSHQKEFFAKMVVDAVLMLDELLPLNMIGIKKITGGALEVTYPAFITESFKQDAYTVEPALSSQSRESIILAV